MKNLGSSRWSSTAVFGLILFASLMTADVAILHMRSHMLPDEAPPDRPQRSTVPSTTVANYSDIASKNIFNRSGEIPPPLGRTEEEATIDADPVPSQLPLTLVGTIVHVNEDRSIATVQVGSQNTVIPVVKGDPIEGMATTIRVERGRLIFRNSNNSRLEYIEIPREEGLKLGRRSAPKARPPGPTEGILQARENEFKINQQFLQESLTNLNSLLQDARAIPNTTPGGTIDGFRFVDIKPGSVFENLGFQPGDVLKAANGETIDSAAKGIQLYQTLRSSNRIELQVERNGRVENFIYNVE